MTEGKKPMPLNAGTQIHRSLAVDMRGGILDLGHFPSSLTRLKKDNPRVAAMLVLAVFLIITATISVSALGNSGNPSPVSTDNTVPKQTASGAQSTASQPAAPVDGTSSSGSATSSSSSSSINVNLQSSSTNGSGSANLEVNGRQVPVNDPNSIHQTYTSDNGNSTVNINVTNGGNM